MAKSKFLLVSLKEEESKKLAQIVSNNTSRKILDYISDKEATESELARELSVPISTIHYNLSALVNGKLVEAEEYHYSAKGKEMLHYRLANKYIIIAPKSTWGIKEKLMSILPASLIAIIISSIIWLKPEEVSRAATDSFALKSAPAAEAMLADTAPAVAMASGIDPALWFLLGCMLMAVLILVTDFIIYKKKALKDN